MILNRKTMFNLPESFPRFSPVGESALLVELDDVLSPAVNHQVIALDARMLVNPLAGVLEWVPAYTSLLVIYDPLWVKYPIVHQWLEDCMRTDFTDKQLSPKRWEISVVYGGVDGPDLEYVADFHGLSPGDVIDRHTAQVYRVGMMGFTPGFAYLIGMDQTLATPRLDTPRAIVPRGSVGIAGAQTGIYPLDSPGGWQLIGRTDQVLFNPDHKPHFLLSPGDEVRFISLKDGA
jgi:inhibitor of KinA